MANIFDEIHAEQSKQTPAPAPAPAPASKLSKREEKRLLREAGPDKPTSAAPTKRNIFDEMHEAHQQGPSAWKRYAHSAGLPATPAEVPSMVSGMLHPEPSPTHPSALQTIPIIGPAFRAQRETYEGTEPWDKVYGLIPLVGPPAKRMGDQAKAGDYAGALGSATNIIMQLVGAKGKSAAPGAIESVTTDIGTQVKPTVPYKPGQAVAPSVAVTGAPGFVGRVLSSRFGLSPDYADRIASRVEEIRKARADAEATTRETQRSTQAGTQGVQTAAETDIGHAQRQAEQTRSAIERQRDQAISKTQRDVQGSTQGIQKELESQTAEAERAGKQTQASIESQRDQLIATLEKEEKDAKVQHVTSGKHLLADTAKAAHEEYQRVQRPFQEIGAAIGDAPVRTTDQICDLITAAVKDAGAKADEVPPSVFKALRKGTKEGGEVVPEGVEPGQEFIARAPVTFADLTRIREDLWDASVHARDTAVRRGLRAAHEQVSELQSQVAQHYGYGEQYAAAKRDYMLFRRGIGSGMVEKWLASSNMQEQAVIPKLAKLTNPSTASALRDVLKSVGIDVAPLDDIIARGEKAGESAKAVAKETPKAATEAAADTKARITQLTKDATGRIAVVRRGAADHIKTLRREAKEQIAATTDTARAKEIQQRADQQITAIEKASTDRIKDIEKTRDTTVAEVQKTGAEVVPGKTVEELAGKSNEALNRERLETIVNSMKAKGITNASGLLHILYGTFFLLMGHAYGALPVGYGLLQEMSPQLMRDPRFQNWVVERAGVVPGSTADTGLRAGLTSLAEQAVKKGAAAPAAAAAGQVQTQTQAGAESQR
jgi:hypothetical protein